MLQSEEQAMAENLDSFSHSLAMFASGNKNSTSSHPQPHNHGGSNRGRGKDNGNRGRGGGRFNNSHGGGQHQFFNSQPQQSYISPQNAQFGGQTLKNDRPSCQICGKAGHQALDCYPRMDFAYQGKNPQTKLAAMALASNVALTNCQDPWLADLGTSDHLTAN